MTAYLLLQPPGLLLPSPFSGCSLKRCILYMTSVEIHIERNNKLKTLESAAQC